MYSEARANKKVNLVRQKNLIKLWFFSPFLDGIRSYKYAVFYCWNFQHTMMFLNNPIDANLFILMTLVFPFTIFLLKSLSKLFRKIFTFFRRLIWIWGTKSCKTNWFPKCCHDKYFATGSFTHNALEFSSFPEVLFEIWFGTFTTYDTEKRNFSKKK